MADQHQRQHRLIAVDMDEVLSATTPAIAQYHNDVYGTSLAFKDYSVPNLLLSSIWGGTEEEAMAKWKLFWTSSHFSNIGPVSGAQEALQTLKNYGFEFVVVTARTEFSREATKSFLDRFYPNIFQGIFFANHHLSKEEASILVSVPKSTLCLKVGAELLVDDSLHNAVDVAKEGMAVLLFDNQGSYGWSKLATGESLPDNVRRVHTWDEIRDVLMASESLKV